MEIMRGHGIVPAYVRWCTEKEGVGKGERPMLKNQMKLDEELLENIWGGRPGSVYEFTHKKIDGMFIDGKNTPGGNEDILKPTHS